MLVFPVEVTLCARQKSILAPEMKKTSVVKGSLLGVLAGEDPASLSLGEA